MTNWKIIGFFFAGTVLFLLLLRWQGMALFTPAAPAGIVSLEFSHNVEQTQTMVAEWESNQLLSSVRLNLLLDFFVIPFYGLFLYSLCGYFSIQYKPGALQRAGVLMAFGSLVAMLFDVVENLMMFISTYINVSAFSAAATAICATIKFSLIGLAVLYILVSGVYFGVRKKIAPAS